ncbi:hypothetical protein PS15m_008747 [Mucor circinelloides]
MQKPKLNAVRGDYQIPEQVKERFGLTSLLKASANNWVDPTCKNYLKLLSSGLEAFSKSKDQTEKIRKYAGGVANYLKEEAVIRKCNFYYKLKSTKAEAERQEVLARLQGDATGAALSNAGARELRKRLFDEVFSEDNDEEESQEEEVVDTETNRKASFSLSKNAVQYEIHTQSNAHLLSPKKPIMQKSDRAQVSKYFDLRLGSDVTSGCSEELEAEYKYPTLLKLCKITAFKL